MTAPRGVRPDERERLVRLGLMGAPVVALAIIVGLLVAGGCTGAS